MAKEITGFYNYYWRPYWGQIKSEHEFVHTQLDPDSKSPPIKITADVVDRSFSYKKPDSMLFKLNNKGKGVKRTIHSKDELEESIGSVFAELIAVNGMDFLFGIIFKNK